MSDLRIGIIGIGNMGSTHAERIYAGKINNLTLAAVCDCDPARLDWAKTALPDVPCFSDYNDMLSSGLIDCVLIATPHNLHPEITIEAFSHSLHVLTEKPAGVSASRVMAMNEAAEQSGKVFGIMWNQRTNPLFKKAREFMQNGTIGRPKRLVWIVTNWYRSQSYYDSASWRATWAGEGGGVLLNQAPHNIDLWQWIFGMPSKIRASCFCGKYHNIEVEDDVTIEGFYDNGATATFITSTGEFPGTNRLEISGDRGKMVLENGTLKLWQLPFSEREACFSEKQGFPSWELKHEDFIPDEPETAHNGILQNFTNAILFGEELLAPGSEGLKEITISNAAYLSSWTDSTVTIPFDTEQFDILLGEKIKTSHIREPKSTENDHAKGQSCRWQVRW